MLQVLHFRILDLKASKQEHSFIFSVTKVQIFGAKKELFVFHVVLF